MNGFFQWHIVWFAHDKFILGVSGVFLNEKEQVLLLRHRFWADGSWGLPGGYVRKKEQLEDALKREVMEETGYSVEVEALLRIVSGYKLRLEASFTGHIVDGELRIDRKEIIEARFFDLDEIPIGLIGSHRELIDLAFRSSESLVGQND